MSEEADAEIDQKDVRYDNEDPTLYDRFLIVMSSLEDVNVICDIAWKHFEKAQDQCSLEGRAESWMACAIYSAITLQQQIGQPTNYDCSLSEILTACDISPLEFFDKMVRWKEVMNSPRRLFDQMCRMQGSLSVSAVVFKRFLPIVRNVFNQVEGEEVDIETFKICKAIWLAFLLLKKHYVSSASEDLITIFHLLLCITEHFIKDLSQSYPHYIHPDILTLNLDTDLLELMCRQFNGVVLDGKHLRAHWFTDNATKILQLKSPMMVMDNLEDYLISWDNEYIGRLRRRGELDERIVMSSNPIHLFDPMYEVESLDELRRSLGQSRQMFDAHFYMKLSTQSCLNKLSEKMNNGNNTLTVNTEQSSPTNMIALSEQKAFKLANLLPSHWSLEGSELEVMLLEVRDSPLNIIKDSLANLSDRLEKLLLEEEEEYEYDRDTGVTLIREHIGALASQLFYRLLEQISRVERDRTKDYEFINMFRKEEFITSLFVMSVEILLDTYGSDRLFPWSITVFKVAPISFYKIIEMVVKSEAGFARETIRHLNEIEETILEEMAWIHESPLWSTLSRRADCVPSSQSIWVNESEGRLISSQYSPIKKRRRDDGRVINSRSNVVTPATLFFRKIYIIAAARLYDMCERLKMDEKGRTRVWTIFEHSLRTETTLYAGRHLDQNLMCILYVTGKLCKMEITFHDIMSNYRQQPQASARVYREVFIDISEIPPELSPTPDHVNGALVDLIKYYNVVFIRRVEEIVRRIEMNDAAIQLIPIPLIPSQMISPAKKAINDRVFVSPLSSINTSTSTNPSVRTLKYNMSKSPVKDLKMINKVVHRGASSSSITSGVNRPYSQMGYRFS